MALVTKTAEAAPEKAEPAGIVSIDEEAWTVRDTGTMIINRPHEWTTQDYEKNPPAQVLWERPYDCI